MVECAGNVYFLDTKLTGVKRAAVRSGQQIQLSRMFVGAQSASYKAAQFIIFPLLHLLNPVLDQQILSILFPGLNVSLFMHNLIY